MSKKSLTRRSLLWGAVGVSATAGDMSTRAPALPLDHSQLLKPEAALRRLQKGNLRYAYAHQNHPHEDPSYRRSIVRTQHPFAVVLGCVDSRVPPEIVFDQGLGDLLTVRTAGEAIDDAVLGSIAYGVEELHVPLIVVLGHQRCGAVSAAVEYVRTHRELEPHMMRLVHQIVPSVQQSGDDWVENTVRANISRVCTVLATDRELGPVVASGQLRIVGAKYALDTGTVDFRIY